MHFTYHYYFLASQSDDIRSIRLICGEGRLWRDSVSLTHHKYFRWLFLVLVTRLSPIGYILVGNRLSPVPRRIPCPVWETSSIAPPRGLVTTPSRPFPTPVITPLAASLISLARWIPCIGWSTKPATAPRRLRPKLLSPWVRPANGSVKSLWIE